MRVMEVAWGQSGGRMAGGVLYSSPLKPLVFAFPAKSVSAMMGIMSPAFFC